MHLIFKIVLSMSVLSLIRSYTHDEIAKCSLTGVYKTRQATIESPNYPNNYKANTCWDYVIRSPYKCPTTFHIQFLDFYLEFSKDCKNDYLAIGLENIDDDMDVLCGQVVGIKKYHTPDGILRLRFYADESPWTTGKGFKLLVTRLACEREELLRELKDDDSNANANDDDDDDDEDDDDTITVTAPSRSFEPPQSQLMQIFRNLTGPDQYQIIPLPPVFSLNYPTQLPSPPYPATGTIYVPPSGPPIPSSSYPGSNVQNNFQYPCTNGNGQQTQLPNIPNSYGALKGNQLASYPHTLTGNVPANYLPSSNINQVQIPQTANTGFLSIPRDQYIGSWSSTPTVPRAYDNTIDSLEACCVSAFQQKHFYLSSPGFPRTIFSNILPSQQKRDCVFRLQKSSPHVCRLRLDFKFFDFGQSFHGTGSYLGNIGSPAIQNTQDICREDYIEIANQRFCGCRSGYTFTLHWASAKDKTLRMRMGYSGVPSGGFLLEIVQEECSESQLALMTTERPIDATLTTSSPNLLNNQHQAIGVQQVQDILLEQQKKRLYGESYPAQHHQLPHNINSVSYPGNYGLQPPNYLGQSQQFFSTPASFSSHLQPQNPLFIQQQQQQQQHQLQNNNLYPSQFSSNYLSYLPSQGLQQNVLQQPVLATNPYGLSQIRYARSYEDQQPLSIVETNSTRKEYYFAETDSLNYNENLSPMSRSSTSETSSHWDRKDTNIKERNDSNGSVAREGKKCTFDMGDILRLSVDILWITKPICYAPQRNWFTNWIG